MKHRRSFTLVHALLGAACAGAPARPAAELRFAVAAAALLPIGRQWSGTAPAAATAWCAEAHDAVAWRALQSRLGAAADCFGADFVLPPDTRVVAIVAAAAQHAAAGVRVATEEGVDVLTFSTVVAAGAPRSPAWVLVVPERRQQLAVLVAAPAAGFEVPIETLLQVFEPR